MDIPDIRRVIQYKVPDGMDDWTQHGGRGGRDGKDALAIILVEKSVFQTQKKRRGKLKGKGKATEMQNITELEKIPASGKRKRLNEDQEPEDLVEDDQCALSEDGDGEEVAEGFEYRKKVQHDLRQWLVTLRCRQIISDRYYQNPKRETIGNGKYKQYNLSLLTSLVCHRSRKSAMW